MSSPTIICSLVRDNVLYTATSYYENDRFYAVTQSYKFNNKTGRTTLLTSDVFSSEHSAIAHCFDLIMHFDLSDEYWEFDLSDSI